MAVVAFIMLKVRTDSTRGVLEKVKSFAETKQVHIIFGAYDMIVKAEFKDNDEMSRFVVDKLKSLDGVIETATNVCAI
ncbi:MAG: Lrp/AsnC ligand binding domain-containing protein [Candidatus Thorarchaeota archaeon]|nr:Lrp/AsnC ligand binding domain-containing protein [Candidatus Thorarchaeota archaeon]